MQWGDILPRDWPCYRLHRRRCDQYNRRQPRSAGLLFLFFAPTDFRPVSPAHHPASGRAFLPPSAAPLGPGRRYHSRPRRRPAETLATGIILNECLSGALPHRCCLIPAIWLRGSWVMTSVTYPTEGSTMVRMPLPQAKEAHSGGRFCWQFYYFRAYSYSLDPYCATMDRRLATITKDFSIRAAF